MSTMGNVTIGDRIKECRKDMGLSQEALNTSPNYLLLGPDGIGMDEKWIEDVMQVLKKITEPPYRELALNQLKCIVNMVA